MACCSLLYFVGVHEFTYGVLPEAVLRQSAELQDGETVFLGVEAVRYAPLSPPRVAGAGEDVVPGVELRTRYLRGRVRVVLHEVGDSF